VKKIIGGVVHIKVDGRWDAEYGIPMDETEMKFREVTKGTNYSVSSMTTMAPLHKAYSII
jgi:hypothetical protein